jgi:hypothetical protein
VVSKCRQEIRAISSRQSSHEAFDERGSLVRRNDKPSPIDPHALARPADDLTARHFVLLEHAAHFAILASERLAENERNTLVMCQSLAQRKEHLREIRGEVDPVIRRDPIGGGHAIGAGDDEVQVLVRAPLAQSVDREATDNSDEPSLR